MLPQRKLGSTFRWQERRIDGSRLLPAQRAATVSCPGRQRRWRTIIVAWVNAAVRSDIASSARIVGSSSRDAQPRHVEFVHAAGVAVALAIRVIHGGEHI